MSNFNPQGGGLQYRGTKAVSPPNCTFDTRNPTTYDTQGFSLLDEWLNTETNEWFKLVSLEGNSSSRRSLATWVLISSSTGDLLTLTGDTGGAVSPDSNGNITVLGNTGPISVVGSANKLSLDLIGANGTVLEGTGTASQFTNSPSVTKMSITGTPSAPTDAVNVAYVDAIASGFTFISSVLVATTADLGTVVYNNGAAGVGATLTNGGVQSAITIDGVVLSSTNRVLVKNESNQTYNGIYSVTTVGSGSTNWVLTRTTDYDTVPPIAEGNIVPVTSGAVNSDTLWIQTYNVITIGTSPIVWVPFGVSPIPPISGSLILLENKIVSSPTASVTFTGLTSVQYNNYVFYINNIITDQNTIPGLGVSFFMQVSTNGGSSYFNSGYSGFINNNYLSNSTVSTNSPTGVPLSISMVYPGSGIPSALSGQINCYSITDGNAPYFNSNTRYVSTGSTMGSINSASTSAINQPNVNAFQFILTNSSGTTNIQSGVFSLYGIAL